MQRGPQDGKSPVLQGFHSGRLLKGTLWGLPSFPPPWWVLGEGLPPGVIQGLTSLLSSCSVPRRESRSWVSFCSSSSWACRSYGTEGRTLSSTSRGAKCRAQTQSSRAGASLSGQEPALPQLRFSRKDRGLDHMPKGEAQLTACTEAASFSMKGDRL